MPESKRPMTPGEQAALDLANMMDKGDRMLNARLQVMEELILRLTARTAVLFAHAGIDPEGPDVQAKVASLRRSGHGDG